jgi:SAM-dependent methyltransferase
MKHDPALGLAAPELGWVPSPGFVLRRAAALGRVRAWRPGRALEVGCGAGALLVDLAELGFTSLGVETSPQALALARRLLAGRDGIELSDRLPDVREVFDFVLGFEVLEHIEDDRAALADWCDRLRPGGRCLLSVPAHRRSWNLTDRLAGHFRRYERDDVESLVRDAGLTPIAIETYGFPLSWVLERVRRAVRAIESRRRGADPEAIPLGDAARTSASGVDRSIETRLFPFYSAGPGRWLLLGGARLQRLFRRRDWGISFLIEARK